MLKKFFGVFFTLICFFGSMLLAFGAEFLMEDIIIFFLLIGISLGFFIFGIVICKKRKVNTTTFYWEIIITEIILAVVIIPTGLLEKFILNRIVHSWETNFFTGIQWIVYPCISALFLFLLAIVTGLMDFFRYLSEQGVFESKDENKDKVRFL